eukprot:TRINITY_DN18224_c0_g1_i1.p1 TRINITY_DN18224_c0_g1~~TRINITY_DN18224_c0_g1_i1.p1  ORF type:complete len:747 (-),score=138.34 TRINITY_DN18224_c0_g1_i1:980-3220(-)
MELNYLFYLSGGIFVLLVSLVSGIIYWILRKGKDLDAFSEYLRNLDGTNKEELESLIHSFQLTTDDLKMIITQFKEIEVHKDGKIRFEEFAKSMGLLGRDPFLPRLIFTAFDSGNKGSLDFTEFLCGLVVMTRGSFEDKIKIGFKIFDRERRGLLPKSEIRRMISAMKSSMSRSLSLIDHPGDAYLPPDELSKDQEEVVTQFVDWLDSDDDGYISYEQYLSAAKKDPHSFQSLFINLVFSTSTSPADSDSSGDSVEPGPPPPLFPLGKGLNRRMSLTKLKPVSFGHKSFELVLRIMVGIRLSLKHSIGSSASHSTTTTSTTSSLASSSSSVSSLASSTSSTPYSTPCPSPRKTGQIRLNTECGCSSSRLSVGRKEQVLDVQGDHYQEILTVSLPQEGSARFDLVSFAPRVFRELRATCGISDREFSASLGVEQLLGNILLGNLSTLSESFTEEKSGSVFYRSYDRKYIIKTLRPSEQTALVRLLPAYHRYLMSQPNSLLSRFFGLFQLFCDDTPSLTFVVMNNVFSEVSLRNLHERYDLKGLHFRRADGWSLRRRKNKGAAIGRAPLLYETELCARIDYLGHRVRLMPNVKTRLMSQLEKDSCFLADQGIYDYSLLIGVSYITRDRIMGPRVLIANMMEKNEVEDKRGSSSCPETVVDIELEKMKKIGKKDEVFCDGYESDYEDKLKGTGAIMYVGVIDVLKPFTFRQRIMEWLITYGSFGIKQIAASSPHTYTTRFLRFIDRVFE